MTEYESRPYYRGQYDTIKAVLEILNRYVLFHRTETGAFVTVENEIKAAIKALQLK